MNFGTEPKTFALGTVSVAGPCFPDHTRARAIYSESKRGYELHLDDLLVGESPGGPAVVSINGDHVTIEETLYVQGAVPLGSTCTSQSIDLGALNPGTYRLTWIYDASRR